MHFVRVDIVETFRVITVEQSVVDVIIIFGRCRCTAKYFTEIGDQTPYGVLPSSILNREDVRISCVKHRLNTLTLSVADSVQNQCDFSYRMEVHTKYFAASANFHEILQKVSKTS